METTRQKSIVNTQKIKESKEYHTKDNHQSKRKIAIEEKRNYKSCQETINDEMATVSFTHQKVL